MPNTVGSAVNPVNVCGNVMYESNKGQADSTPYILTIYINTYIYTYISLLNKYILYANILHLKLRFTVHFNTDKQHPSSTVLANSIVFNLIQSETNIYSNK